MKDDEKRMMTDEYGKDLSGCAWTAMIAAVAIVVIIVAITAIFT